MKGIVRRTERWCNRHEWLLFLILLVVLLRIPSLFTPHYYGDEEIYFVMGRAWREGVPLYRGIFDHKPPFIYVMAGIFNTVYLFRTALLAWMTLHTVLFWKLAKKFWGKTKPQLAYLSSLLFVGLTSWPGIEGNIVNAELMMMLPITASLLLVWDAKKGEWRRYLAAGIVAGGGWLFKIPVAMDAMAIALYFFVFRAKTFKASWRGLWSRNFWVYTGGFIFPLALTFAYYYLKGDGKSYLDTILTMNLSYVSSWKTSNWAFNPWRSGLARRGIILGGFTALLYAGRKKLDKRLLFSSLWLAYAWFGALLSGRPYPHYLLQPAVPFALWFPVLLITEKVLGWAVIGYLAIWGIGTQKEIKFWVYQSRPLYENFGKLITKKMSKTEYLESFDGVKRNYAIAKYLNERMVPNKDRLYVWGSDAAVYNLTQKLPAGGKYIVSFHVRDLKKYGEVIENLEKNDPTYIVILPEASEFPELEKRLGARYINTATIERAKVYHLAGPVLGREAEWGE